MTDRGILQLAAKKNTVPILRLAARAHASGPGYVRNQQVRENLGLVGQASIYTNELSDAGLLEKYRLRDGTCRFSLTALGARVLGHALEIIAVPRATTQAPEVRP